MNIIGDLLSQTEKIDFLFPQNFDQLMNDQYYDYDKFEWFLYYVFKFDKLADVKKVGVKGKGDGGADLILSMPQPGGSRYRIGIQAKYWKNKVGAGPINQLASAKTRHDLTHLWIITTSDLTSDAKEIAEQMDIKILRKEDVINLINQVKQIHDKEMAEKGESSIEFLPIKERKIVEKKEYNKKTTKKVEKKTVKQTKSNDDEVEGLRKLRQELAKKHKLYPVYHVYNNATLDSILKIRPKNKKDLFKVEGLGEAKINMFGEDIVNYITSLDSPQFNFLKNERTKIANFNKLKEEDTFSDAAIIEMIQRRPKDEAELLTITGMDESKCNTFGDYLLRAISRLY